MLLHGSTSILRDCTSSALITASLMLGDRGRPSHPIYPFADPNEWRTRLYIRSATAFVIGLLWVFLAVWLYRRKPQLKFAPDKDIQGLSPELAEFVQHVIPDEEPLFISDAATVWDISLSATENELIDRCFIHYGVYLRAEELKQPLSRLLRELKQRRTK